MTRLARCLSKQAHKKQRHLLFLVFTAALQSVILISLVVHWKTERNKQVRQVETKVCYDSNNHKESGRWQRGSNDREEKNVCKQASDILKTLTLQAVEASYDNAANPEVYPAPLQYIPHCRVLNKSLDSIQLHAISTFNIPEVFLATEDATDMIESDFYSILATKELGKPTKLYWSLGSLKRRDTFCNTASVESEGFIEIKDGGLYLVSSKLTVSVVNGTYDPSYTLKGTYFRHYIMLISNRDRQEKILLENELSKCYMFSEKSEKTSQIEAVFKLEDGDRVYIATSHSHRIICAPQKDNFFIQKL